MTAAWRLAIFSEVVSNSVRIGVSNFCTSLCERSCTRNVTLNSPPRDRSGKALFRKFRVRNKELTVTKFAEKGLSGSISRLGGVLRAINSSLETHMTCGHPRGWKVRTSCEIRKSELPFGGFCRIEKSIAYGSLSRESERRGGRSTSRSYLIDA